MKLDIEDDGRITIVCADVGPGFGYRPCNAGRVFHSLRYGARKWVLARRKGFRISQQNSDNMQIESQSGRDDGYV